MDPELRPSEPIQVNIIDDDQQGKNKRKRRKKKAEQFRDLDKEQGFQLDNGEFIGDASWLEVCQGCFVHSLQESVCVPPRRSNYP
jgi:hypothetical protein